MSTMLTAHGVLHPDGWIRLLNPPELPAEPCEVEITLSVSKPANSNEVPPPRGTREPSGFFPDESISAPFDLPHYGTVRRVTVQPATGPYFPDPVFIAVGDEVLE